MGNPENPIDVEIDGVQASAKVFIPKKPFDEAICDSLQGTAGQPQNIEAYLISKRTTSSIAFDYRGRSEKQKLIRSPFFHLGSDKVNSTQ